VRRWNDLVSLLCGILLDYTVLVLLVFPRYSMQSRDRLGTDERLCVCVCVCCRQIQKVWLACHWLAMSHCCCNPVVYCCMNTNYRTAFRRLFTSILSPCRVARPPPQPPTGCQRDGGTAHTPWSVSCDVSQCEMGQRGVSTVSCRLPQSTLSSAL